jgi:hypothetical protein
MRAQLIVPIVVLFFVIATLTGCTPSTTAKPNVKLESATLQGQSEHWKVKVNYLIKDATLEEVTSIEFLGAEELTEAAVSIAHKDQPPLTYNVVAPDLLKAGQAITLGERAKVLSWQDTEQIVMQWKIGTNTFKEYITPSKA